jgi:hypothetical protein
MRVSTTANHHARWLGLASGISLTAIIFFVYSSSLTTGFFSDDYKFLEPVVRLNLLDYLIRYFDPRLQTLWYRPIQGVQIWLEWQLFGAGAVGYHIVNVLIHSVNAMLLFALTWRVSQKWRVAFLSALFYATFPVYALAVNWINITDPAMAIFYLGGVWFWLNDLEHATKNNYLCALGAFVLALLYKQMAITLPIVLFLIDRLLIAKPIAWPGLVRRYAAFGVVGAIFAVVQYTTRSTHIFAEVFGYSPGMQIVSILIQYLSLWVFPWGYYPPTDTQITEGFPFADTGNLVWLASSIALFVFLAASRKNRVLLMIGAMLIVTLLPVLSFHFIELRYLYLPAMLGGIIIAILFEHAYTILKNAKWARIASAIAIAAIVIGSQMSIANANAGIAEIGRQRRVPFRDIERQHPTFPTGTHLYFIDPISPLEELTGLFALRYGRSVSVSGDRAPEITPLRAYESAYVYYFDETGKPIEVPVDMKYKAQASQAFPIVFSQPIILDDVEIVQSSVKRGNALVALLHWHASAELDHDYTVFVHLIDTQGKILAAYNEQPRKGAAPTTSWRRYVPVVDPIVMPIPPDVPPGDSYRLEVGLFYLPTMERLSIVDALNHPLGDALILQPLAVQE